MEHVLLYLSHFGYLALFPLAIIEGPIITVIGGFFVRLGILNPVYVYLIVIAGDIVGDMLYYAIGHFGKNKFLHWIGRHIGVTEERLIKVREHYADHGYKTIAASKLLQGIGPIGLIAAGSARVPYPRYMLMCLSVSLVQSALFLTLGYLFGHAYVEISHYLNVFAAILGLLLIAVVIGFILYRNGLKKSQ